MKTNTKKTLPAILLLMAAILACNLPVSGLKPAVQKIPVSDQAAQSLESTVTSNLENATSSQPVVITLSEEQITSYLAKYLRENTEFQLTDPQVHLRNGRAEIDGKYQQGVLSANITLIVAVTVDENGNPKATITSADFGPIPAPTNMLDTLSATINESLTGSLGPSVTGIKISSIQISDGLITISGTRQ